MALSPRRLLRRFTRRFRRVPAGGPGLGGRPGRGWHDDGGASVREPRRPLPKPTAGAAALPLPEESQPV